MINKSNYLGNMVTAVVTILSGATKSEAIDLQGLTLVGVFLGTFTGTTLTFEASASIDGTYVPVKAGTSGAALSYTVAQNTYAAIDQKDTSGLNYLKIVSGSAEAADREITLVLKGL